MVLITTISPLALPTTWTFTGLWASINLSHFLAFTTSMTRVLLGSSNRTNLPSEVTIPKVVVVVVTGHSVDSVVVFVVVVLDEFSVGLVVSADRFSVCVVLHAASTSVPFQVVVVVVSVRGSCAH